MSVWVMPETNAHARGARAYLRHPTVDDLDECIVTSIIPSPRGEVLELVKDLVRLHLPNLHTCVTSRPEPDIQMVLKSLIECSVSLHDESGQKGGYCELYRLLLCSLRSKDGEMAGG